MASPVTTSYAGVLPQVGESRDSRPWPTLLVVTALWLLNINQLRVEWTINPQYTYGWTVPFLALYLFAERWKCRPRTSPMHHAMWLGILVAVTCLCLLPLRLIQEASPDWRAVNWALASAAAAISLTAIYFAGGRSWLFHFAVPVLFILVAVPWPMPIERTLVQGLMRTVTSICVEALTFFSIPAIQQGNVIQIATGKVGIEEACSGVRSLQTTLMASIFLGELFRFTFNRRFFLLVGGLGLAFVCNLFRSFFLVWISVHDGNASVLKWHDRVGVTVLLLSLGGLALLCTLLRPRGDDGPENHPGATPDWRPRFAPRAVILSVACWLVVVEAGTEFWYRSHETSGAFASWFVHWPVAESGFREIPLTESVRAMLRYDEGRSVAWNGAENQQWSMIFLRWLPGRASMQLARSHGPEVCLAANGAVLRSDLGVKSMPIGGLDLPMHSYIFTVRDSPLYVFYCLWEDRPSEDGTWSTRQDMTAERKLRAVFYGRRNTGQQVIEVALAGARTPEEAEAATTKLLEGVIYQ